MARERSQRNRRISETERRKARQSRNKQKNRVIKILAAVGMGILAILIIAGLALPSFGGGGSTTVQDFLDRGGFFARPAPGPGEEVEDLGRVHFDTLSERASSGYYNSSPATSGTHSPTWERCGIFEEPVQDEILVHNLEHGFVNVHYNTTDPILIGQIEAAARGLPNWPNYYLFAPYPDMDATIALTAWNRVLYLDSVDEDAHAAVSRTPTRRAAPRWLAAATTLASCRRASCPSWRPPSRWCRSQLRPPPAATTAPTTPRMLRKTAAQPRSRSSRRHRTPGSGSTHAVHGEGLCDAEDHRQ